MKSLLKDKAGKSSSKVGVIALVVILLASIVALAVVGINKGWFVKQSVAGTGSGGIVDCGDNEPYIDNATFNQYAKGTSVGVTFYYTIEGEDAGARTLTPGSSGTVFSVGDNLKIMSTASSYLDRVDDFTITKCGANKFTNYIYGADGGTVTILDQNYNTVTNSATGGAVNVSESANPVNFIVRLDGVVDESTGQLLITVEGNDTQIDDMTISGKSSDAKVIDGDYPTGNLNLFSAEGTAPSIKKAFVVDEILDGGQADYNVKLTPESGITIGAGTNLNTCAMYVNVYAGQWFVDTDGSLQFGWEDSDGTAKYETKFTDYDFVVE